MTAKAESRDPFDEARDAHSPCSIIDRALKELDAGQVSRLRQVLEGRYPDGGWTYSAQDVCDGLGKWGYTIGRSAVQEWRRKNVG